MKDKFLAFLGIDRMSDMFVIFSTIHLGFLLFYTLQSIFINTLLQRFAGNTDIVFWYNIVFLSLIPVGMSLGTFLVKRRSSKFSMQLGLWLWFAIQAATLTLILTRQLHYFWLFIAIMSALANGYYWISYYMALTDYTGNDNRDVGLSIIGVYTGIANILVPIIAGYVISAFGNYLEHIFFGYFGYIIMFGLAFLSTVWAIIKTRKLKPPKQKGTDKHVHIIKAYKAMISNKVWLYGSLMELFRGTRDGVFIFYLNMIIFSVIQEESIVGFNSFLSGAVSILASWVLGKVLSRHTNKSPKIKWMLIATTVLFLSGFLLILKLNVTTLIIMTCISTFFGVFLANIAQSIFCMSTQCDASSINMRAESFVLKSYFLAIGRAIGIVFVVLLPESNFYIILAIIVLSALQYLTVAAASKTLSLLENTE